MKIRRTAAFGALLAFLALPGISFAHPWDADTLLVAAEDDNFDEDDDFDEDSAGEYRRDSGARMNELRTWLERRNREREGADPSDTGRTHQAEPYAGDATRTHGLSERRYDSGRHWKSHRAHKRHGRKRYYRSRGHKHYAHSSHRKRSRHAHASHKRRPGVHASHGHRRR